MPVYRYRSLGVNASQLQGLVPGTITIGSAAPLTFVDVDAEAFAKADLDAAMEGLAWIYVETDPGNSPAQAASTPGRSEDLSTPGPIAGVAILLAGGVAVVASDRLTPDSRVTAFFQPAAIAPQGILFPKGVDATSKTFTIASTNAADEGLPFYWQIWEPSRV